MTFLITRNESTSVIFVQPEVDLLSKIPNHQSISEVVSDKKNERHLMDSKIVLIDDDIECAHHIKISQET